MVAWKYVLFLVMYSYAFVHVNGISLLQHSFEVKKPFIKRMVSANDIISGTMVIETLLRGKK